VDHGLVRYVVNTYPCKQAMNLAIVNTAADFSDSPYVDDLVNYEL